MVFNIRGTGRSHGKPNEDRSYHDIEAVYQYLISKGFSPNQICVNGYCLGAGLAVDLASRYPVNLILDRPFAKIGDVMADVTRDYVVDFVKLDPENRKTQMIGNLTSSVLSSLINVFVISYDNVSKLRRVKGSILYVHSENDEVIPEGSRNRITKVLRGRSNVTVQISDAFEHCEAWDTETEEVHHNHLRRFGMSRRYPNTSIPLSLVMDRLTLRPLRLAKTKVDAAVILGAAAVSGGGTGAAVAVLALGGSEAYKWRKEINRKMSQE